MAKALCSGGTGALFVFWPDRRSEPGSRAAMPTRYGRTDLGVRGRVPDLEDRIDRFLQQFDRPTANRVQD